MFCPKCGQQNTETVRFCTRCGFRLIAVKQLLTTDGLPGDEAQPALVEAYQLRRKELNLGTLVMYFGSLFALLVGVFQGHNHESDRTGAMFALEYAQVGTFLMTIIAFPLILLGAVFFKRRLEMMMGVILMCLFSTLALYANHALGPGGVETVAQYGKAQLLALTVGLAVLLWIGQPLMQRLVHGVSNLFAKEPLSLKTSAHGEGTKVTLPSAQNSAVEVGANVGATTSELTPRAVAHSVTEASTQLLEKELD